jgi:hypothetical protein
MPHPPLTDSQKRFRTRSMIVSLGATALLAVAALAAGPLMPHRPLGTDDILCIAAALISLQMGLIMGFVHAVQPKDAPMPRARLIQVLNFICAGSVLVLPILGERFIDRDMNFVLIMALYAANAWMTWVIWREADEFMRAMLRDACLASYHVIALALALYATGERLDLIHGATAWGFLGFIGLVNILCSFWSIYRHGADRPPAEE